MGKKKSRGFDKFLSDIDNILESIGDTSSLAEIEFGKDRDKIREEIEALDLKLGPAFGGTMEISISEDEMTAYADFHPPVGEGALLTPEYAAALLANKGVGFGVDWEKIKETCFTCNIERVQLTDVLIAVGESSVDEIPEHLVLKKELITPKSVLEKEALKVDYKESSPFAVIKKSEVLAVLMDRKPGVIGTTVKGAAIPFSKSPVPQLKPGKNTVREGREIKAGCDGRFIFQNDAFWVNEVLEIRTDVDFSTGNITFPGDVVIFGEVKDGFQIKSDSSVYCKKTLDASDVFCKGDLVVDYGIIGRKEGSVRVGGDIHAKFIENCYVESNQSIYIKTCIMNSIVFSLQKVEMGINGSILGGKIVALNGIATTNLGTANQPKTELVCGIDYTVQNKILMIRDNNIKLALKLQEIEKQLKAGTGDPAALTQYSQKIRDKIHELNEAAIVLLQNLDKNEDAEVVVRDTVHPGVYIEICHQSFIVSRKMQKVRFKLDKQKGNIIASRL